MKDHPVLNDPDRLSRKSVNDWLALFKKHFNHEYHPDLEAVVVDLELLSFSDDENLSSKIELIMLSESQIRGVAQSIYLLTLRHGLNPYSAKSLYTKLNQTVPDKFIGVLRAQIRFDEFHHNQRPYGTLRRQIKYSLDWIRFLHAYEIILEKADPEIGEFFLDIFKNIDDKASLKQLNLKLYAFLESTALIEKPEGQTRKHNKSKQNLSEIFDYGMQADFNVYSLFNDQSNKATPWRSPEYISRSKQFEKTDKHIEYLCAMNESRVGEIFDEEGVLNYWGISNYSAYYDLTNKESVAELYRAFGMLQENETLSDEIFNQIRTRKNFMHQDEDARENKKTQAESHDGALKFRNKYKEDIESPFVPTPPVRSLIKLSKEKKTVRFDPMTGPPVLIDERLGETFSIDNVLHKINELSKTVLDSSLKSLNTTLSLMKFLINQDKPGAEIRINLFIKTKMDAADNIGEFAQSLTGYLENPLRDEYSLPLSFQTAAEVRQRFGNEKFREFIALVSEFYQRNLFDNKTALIWINLLHLYDTANRDLFFREFTFLLSIKNIYMEKIVDSLKCSLLDEMPVVHTHDPQYPAKLSDITNVFEIDDNGVRLPTFYLLEHYKVDSSVSVDEVTDLYIKYGHLGVNDALEPAHIIQIFNRIYEYILLTEKRQLTEVDAYKNALALSYELADEARAGAVTSPRSPANNQNETNPAVTSKPLVLSCIRPPILKKPTQEGHVPRHTVGLS